MPTYLHTIIPLQCNVAQSNSIQYDLMQYNVKEYDAMQFNLVALTPP